MIARLKRAAEQLSFLRYETKKLVGPSPWRWGSIWFNSAWTSIAAYRVNRSGYLAFGPAWSAARIVFAPAIFVAKPWMGGCDINYHADIGKGLRIMHPSLGVVISGKTVAGKNLFLVGGNCIGGRKTLGDGEIRLGDNVLLGANAVVLGPINVGDGVQIGAGALLVRDTPDGTIVKAPLAEVVQPRPRTLD